MNNMLKVKDHDGLLRDPYSKAIININEKALLEHRKNKNFARKNMQNSQKIKSLEEEIANIKLLLIQFGLSQPVVD